MEKINKKEKQPEYINPNSEFMKAIIKREFPDDWKKLWESFAKDVLHMDESEYKEIDSDNEK